MTGSARRTPRRKDVATVVDGLRDWLEERPSSAGGLVVCTHRPVLPWLFEALGLEDPELAPGELVVAHLRKGSVRVAERHLVR